MEDFLSFLFEMICEPFVELFFAIFAAMFSGLWEIRDMKDDLEKLSVVPRLPAGAAVLLAKGGR